MEEPRIIEFPKICDRRGNLSFIEGSGADFEGHVPFDIKRVYWIYDVPGGQSRGAHAHRTLQQLIVAVSGSFTVTLDDGQEKKEFFLNHPWMGLYVPPGMWRNIEDFSSGAVCMVLASNHYDESDYIRNYRQFQKFSNERRKNKIS